MLTHTTLEPECSHIVIFSAGFDDFKVYVGIFFFLRVLINLNQLPLPSAVPNQDRKPPELMSCYDWKAQLEGQLFSLRR